MSEFEQQPNLVEAQETNKIGTEYAELARKTVQLWDQLVSLNTIEGEKYKGEAPIVTFDKDGKLVGALVNGMVVQQGRNLEPGYGKLASILKNEAMSNAKSRFEKTGNLSREQYGNDPYIVEAYNTNPQVKEILDQAGKILEERAAVLVEMDQIKREKINFYSNTSNINKFLEQMGYPNRVEEFNVDELVDRIRSSKDPEELRRAAHLAVSTMEAFAGHDISMEEFSNHRVDFEAIQENVFFKIRLAIQEALSGIHSSELYKEITEIYQAGTISRRLFTYLAQNSVLPTIKK